MSKELTTIQENILKFIIEYQSQHNISPSIKEIADNFNYSNRSTVSQHLDALIKKGYIYRKNKMSRNILVVDNPFMFKEEKIIGEVYAGLPERIYSTQYDSILLPKLKKLPKETFLVKVKGESMKDANLLEGDYLIINPNLVPDDKSLVLVTYNDSPLVKKIKYYDKEISLISENREYMPILIGEKDNDSFRILGVVIGMYRKYISLNN